MATTDKTENGNVIETTSKKSYASWVTSNLLWGGSFLLVGALLLLSNLGIVDVHWREAWRLWPILIILAGLSILSLRGWVAIVVYGIAGLVIVALVWATLMGAISYDNGSSTAETFTIGKENSDIKNVGLNITSGPGTLSVSSTNSSNVTEGESRGMHTEFSSEVRSDGDKQTVKLTQSRGAGWFMPGSVSDLDIRINKDLPTDLEIEAGASDINADLSDIKLQSLLMDTGASSIDLKLGNELDNTVATIRTGASSVVVRVPNNSGIRLNLNDELSSKDLPDGYRQTDDNTYTSPNYNKTSKKITIDVDSEVSSFVLKEY